ncbi:MAG: molybdenum cofactor guanylyltransferase [Planctomycetaceae bacterium]|nr:molybdenum cofactor guanylyltransferase [Planctomycetaceae bacterium]
MLAGIVLSGGESRRMEQPKALLPFGPPGQTLLTHILDVVSAVCDPVLVVSAANQELPPLAKSIQLLHDPVPGEGPLAAFAKGLKALPEKVDTVFLCSCDVPLLTTKYIEGLFAALHDDAEFVIPVTENRRHPLTAIYRASILNTVDQLLTEGERSLQKLISRLNGIELTEEQLNQFDPKGDCLLNVNHPEEYQEALLRYQQ